MANGSNHNFAEQKYDFDISLSIIPRKTVQINTADDLLHLRNMSDA
jgi:hypothetical protein